MVTTYLKILISGHPKTFRDNFSNFPDFPILLNSRQFQDILEIKWEFQEFQDKYSPDQKNQVTYLIYIIENIFVRSVTAQKCIYGQ